MNVGNTKGERTCIGVAHKWDMAKFVKKYHGCQGASQFDPHPSTEPTEHGYSMALLHMGARFGRTS